jgi:hypothetical protein
MRVGLGFQQAVKMGPDPISMAIEDLPVVIPGVESHGPGQLETGRGSDGSAWVCWSFIS